MNVERIDSTMPKKFGSGKSCMSKSLEPARCKGTGVSMAAQEGARCMSMQSSLLIHFAVATRSMQSCF